MRRQAGRCRRGAVRRGAGVVVAVVCLVGMGVAEAGEELDLFEKDPRKEKEIIEKNLGEARGALGTLAFGDVRRAMRTAEHRLEGIRRELSRSERKAYKQRLERIEGAMEAKEDSLIEANTAILKREGREAAIEHLQQVLRRFRVSEQKIRVAEEAIMSVVPMTQEERTFARAKEAIEQGRPVADIGDPDVREAARRLMQARIDSVRAAQLERQQTVQREQELEERRRREEEERRKIEEARRLAVEEEKRRQELEKQREREERQRRKEEAGRRQEEAEQRERQAARERQRQQQLHARQEELERARQMDRERARQAQLRAREEELARERRRQQQLRMQQEEQQRRERERLEQLERQRRAEQTRLDREKSRLDAQRAEEERRRQQEAAQERARQEQLRRARAEDAARRKRAARERQGETPHTANVPPSAPVRSSAGSTEGEKTDRGEPSMSEADIRALAGTPRLTQSERAMQAEQIRRRRKLEEERRRRESEQAERERIRQMRKRLRAEEERIERLAERKKQEILQARLSAPLPGGSGGEEREMSDAERARAYTESIYEMLEQNLIETAYKTFRRHRRKIRRHSAKQEYEALKTTVSMFHDEFKKRSRNAR